MTALPLHALPEPWPGPAPFRWNFKGRVIAIDNGATLATRRDFAALMALEALSVISFDPASRLYGQSNTCTHPEFQLFNGVTLGNGSAAQLHACLDPSLSASLAPLPAAQLPAPLQAGAQVLARLPLTSLKLDSIEGLSSLDWLLLDDRHDSLAILAHARRALQSTLLVQLGCGFLPTHQGSADFSQLCQAMAAHGMAFYRLHEPLHLGHFPAALQLHAPRATQLQSAQALFIPTPARLAQLDPQRRLKLAFILDSAYGLHDLAHGLIATVDDGQADAYLEARHYRAASADTASTFTLTAAYSPAPW